MKTITINKVTWMKYGFIPVTVLLFCTSSFSQVEKVMEEPSNGTVEEHVAAPEFMRLPEVMRLREDVLWDAIKFPAATGNPDNYAAYAPFTLKELAKAKGEMRCEIKGPEAISCVTKVISETDGIYSAPEGQIQARLKIVEEDVRFVFNNSGNFRLLRTLYIFLNANDEIIDHVIEVVWKDLDMSQYNYYIIRNTAKEEDIRLFPNPAEDELTVELENSTDQSYTFILTDLQGRQIESLTPMKTMSNSYMAKFNVSSLKAGAYQVTIKTSDSSVTRAFVKK